jgi:hypothetical protein
LEGGHVIEAERKKVQEIAVSALDRVMEYGKPGSRLFVVQGENGLEIMSYKEMVDAGLDDEQFIRAVCHWDGGITYIHG